MRQISEQLTGCVEARHTEVKREKEREKTQRGATRKKVNCSACVCISDSVLFLARSILPSIALLWQLQLLRNHVLSSTSLFRCERTTEMAKFNDSLTGLIKGQFSQNALCLILFYILSVLNVSLKYVVFLSISPQTLVSPIPKHSVPPFIEFLHQCNIEASGFTRSFFLHLKTFTLLHVLRFVCRFWIYEFRDDWL